MMKPFYNILIVFMLLLTGSAVFAQTASRISGKEFKQEIEPVRMLMNKEYSIIRFRKEVFRDPKISQPVESSNGVIYRGKGFNYKMMSAGITVLQLDDLVVVIDSLSKLIQISDPDEASKAAALPGDLSDEMLKNYEIEKTVFPAYSVYKASPQNGAEGTLEFYIDTKTKRLYKLVMTLPEANYFSEDLEDETVEKPYVVVIYEPIQELKKNTDLFSYTPYLKLNEAGKFELTELFSAYELHDARYRPTK